MEKVKAVFLDRDGVINEYPGDLQYVTSWEKFHFLPGVFEALKKLTGRGYKLFIVSNQAGVSKGVYSQENLDRISRNMVDDLRKHNVDIVDVYYCIHRPEDNCSCRKPKTGLVDMAVAKLKREGLEVELGDSYLIGDTARDLETGKAAGLKTILVFSGKEKPENKDNWKVLPDYFAQDLSEAVDKKIL